MANENKTQLFRKKLFSIPLVHISDAMDAPIQLSIKNVSGL